MQVKLKFNADLKSLNLRKKNLPTIFKFVNFAINKYNYGNLHNRN